MPSREWDVVNEPIETGHRMDGLRRNVFLEAFGPDYIRRALVEARALAPRARLMLNEYSLEYDSREERDRRYLFLKLVEGLRRSGAPLDGIGLQGHLDLRKGTVATSSIAAFLRELAGMGLAIVVTELDVKEAEYTAPADRRDRMAADEVRRYLDTVLAEPAVTGVVTWGLSDRHSWLEVLEEDYRRFPGAWTERGWAGLNRGLPYDASMRRKPMYAAIEAALQARDVRRPAAVCIRAAWVRHSPGSLGDPVADQQLVVVLLQRALPHQAQVVAIHAVADPQRNGPEHPPQPRKIGLTRSM